MKRRILGIFAILLLVITFVSAQDIYGNIESGSYGIAQVVASAFGPLLSVLIGGGGDALLFERVLIFFIILGSVYMVIKDMSIFSGNKAIVFIVTFSVSLLAIRFMRISDLIYTVILPYTVLGVALTAFLPLIIGFVFIQSVGENSSFLRKTFWIFFTIVFFTMWDLNSTVSGQLSWMYFWSAIISLLFFFFDGTIRRAMVKSQMDAAGVDSAENMSIRIRDELEKLEKSHTAGHVTEQVYRKIKRRLNKQLDNLLKY